MNQGKIGKQKMKTKFHLNVLLATMVLALAMLPIGAYAQVGGGLSVGNKIPVQNALGRNWTGTNGDPDNSARVEIRQTHTGIILAPTNGPGQVESFNPLVTDSYLGHGVVGINPGTYSEGFMDWSVWETNLTYYVRVFDRSDPSGAIYYADTLPFYGPSDAVSVINPEFGEVKRVDGEPDVDTDGDGIPDAMEGDMGLDAGNPDTDGDGYPDGFEAVHDEYLQPGEPDPSLEIQINPPFALAVDPHTVSWQTIPVPNMEYRLEYRPQWTDETAYDEVWNGMATDTHLEIDVEGLVTNAPVKGFFRVTVPYTIP